MAKITPYGSFITIALLFGSLNAGIVPAIDEILPATSLKPLTATGTSNPLAKNVVAPTSSSSHLPTSWVLFSRISAALRKMLRFTSGGVSAQASNAASAASTALVASATEAEDAWWIIFPVEGFRTSKVLDVWTSLPLIWSGTVIILLSVELVALGTLAKTGWVGG
jgi:hypothetical protein